MLNADVLLLNDDIPLLNDDVLLLNDDIPLLNDDVLLLGSNDKNETERVPEERQLHSCTSPSQLVQGGPPWAT